MMRVTVFLLIAILCACNTTPSPAKIAFVKSMDNLIGHSADDLVAANGPPSNVYMLDSGGRVFEYFKSRARTADEIKNPQALARQQIHASPIPDTRPPAHTRPGVVQPHVLTAGGSCKIQFTISADNIIERWSAEGEGC